MAHERYSAALAKVLKYEGGKVDDPRDPGGRTAYGVTQRTYDAYRMKRGLMRRDVYVIGSSEIQAIYRSSYWDVIRGDALPAGVDLVVFDAAVNSGPARAIKWMQMALGVTPDGKWGPHTDAALRHIPASTIIRKYCEIRLRFLMSLKTWAHFGSGWRKRVVNVEKTALSWL